MSKSSAAGVLIHPAVVGPTGRLVLVVAHVDFKFAPCTAAFPIEVLIARAVEKQAPAEIEIAHQCASEVRDMAYIVAARAQGHEEFDGDSARDVNSHRNLHGKRDQPDLAVGE